LGIFGSYAPGFRTANAAERDVDMFFFQRDGRMSRILTIGASVVQHKLDQIAKRGSA
jgi:hypothetical protein